MRRKEGFVKKFIQRAFQKSDNKGATLVVVIVAMALLGILSSVILYTTYINYKIKLTEARANDNFYTGEVAMEEIKAGLQQEVSNAFSSAYISVMQNYSAYDEVERVSQFQYLYLSGLQNVLQDPTDTTKFNHAKLLGYLSEPEQVELAEASVESLVKYTDSLHIKGLTLTYTDEQGYVAVISTDVVLKIPNVQFESANTLPDMMTYALIADKALRAEGTGTNEILGNIYAGRDGIRVSNGVDLYLSQAENIVTGGNVEVTGSGSSFHVATDSTLWTDGIVVDSSELSLLGSAYVKDDLTVQGTQSVVELSGAYYGYGYQSVSNGAVGPADSSSILINGSLTELDMSGLTKLVLAGQAYIGTKDRDRNGDGTISPDERYYNGMLGVDTKNWRFNTGLGAWHYGDTYNNDNENSVFWSSTYQALGMNVDYTGYGEDYWSEVKTSFWTSDFRLPSANQLTLDFIYDPALLTSGGFSIKILSANGEVDADGAVDLSSAVDYADGLKKVTFSVSFPEGDIEGWFAIGIIGSLTEYKGAIYLDNILINSAAVDGTSAGNEDVRMGQSFAVKSDQLAYLVPAECIGIIDGESVIGTNPVNITTYNEFMQRASEEQMLKENGHAYSVVTEVDLQRITANLPRKLSEYGASYQRVFYQSAGSSNAWVYYYLKFDSPQLANLFFKDYYQYNTSYLNSYMQNYLASYLAPEAFGRLNLAGNAVLCDEEGNYSLTESTMTSDAVSEYTLMMEYDGYGNVYDALNVNLSRNYAILTSEQKSKSVFENIVNASALSACIQEENPAAVIRSFGEEDNPEVILVNNDMDGDGISEGGVYTVPNNTRLRLVIATGDVVVNTNYTGLVIAGGTISVTNGAKITSDPSSVSVVMVKYDEVLKCFVGYEDLDLEEPEDPDAPEEPAEEPDEVITTDSLVSYMNWNKR